MTKLKENLIQGKTSLINQAANLKQKSNATYIQSLTQDTHNTEKKFHL